MSLRRRSTAAILATVAMSAALVVGCSKSSDEQSNESLPDATTLVQQSLQTTRDLKSAHISIVVDGKVEGLPVKTLTGDLTNGPTTAAKGHTKVTLGGDDAEVDFVVIDGTLFASLDPGIWNDFGSASNIYDVSVILNPDEGLANVLANFSNPKADGRETVKDAGDVKTVKITGEVTADAVKKIAPKITATGPVPATVWIREDGGHDLVQAKLEPSPGNSIQMTLSNWNEPVTVEKPPGV